MVIIPGEKKIAPGDGTRERRRLGKDGWGMGIRRKEKGKEQREGEGKRRKEMWRFYYRNTPLPFRNGSLSEERKGRRI